MDVLSPILALLGRRATVHPVNADALNVDALFYTGFQASQYEKVVFLDFNGVLQPRQSAAFKLVPMFNAWLRANPGVGVVVSSAWREGRSLIQLGGYLKEESGRVIGKTPRAPDLRTRLAEIETWMQLANFAGKWAALDDDPMGDEFPRPCPLVRTNPRTGVTAYDLARLSESLR